MSITMSQLASKFLAASRKVDRVTEKRMATLAQVGVGLVKSSIQSYHAVDTGTMLNSTDAEKVSGTEYLIGPTTTYAPFVALGTVNMPARPFHIRAAKQLQSQAAEIMALTPEDLGL